MASAKCVARVGLSCTFVLACGGGVPGTDVGSDPASEAGLDGPHDGALDATADAGPDVFGIPPTGDTYFFVVSRIDLAVPDEFDPNIVPGFNLDDRVSDATDIQGCRKQDTVSGPPYNIEGVDNQLGPLLAEAEDMIQFRTRLEVDVRTGRLLLLLELRGVDDLVNDDLVEVAVFRGNLRPGVRSPALDEDDLLAAGETFDIRPDSVDEEGEALVRLRGSIVGGQLHVGPGSFKMGFIRDDGRPASVEFRNAQLRTKIREEILSAGLLGGGLDVEETFASFMAGDETDSLLQLLLDSAADLKRGQDAGQCTEVSVGLTFSGVKAFRGIISTPSVPRV